MELFQPQNLIEQRICNVADMKKIPITGALELLPLCNMDCKMCYAKMTREQMERHAPMKDWREWLELARQARDAGTMFLLLTGGEIFLYPHFKELYLELKKMGFVVTLNSNGTLINEEIADYLASDPPRRVNITLYGSSDETYARLCGNPHGFTQTTRGIELLLKKGVQVKINCSVTPYNVEDLDGIFAVARRYRLPIEAAYYMTPAVREENEKNTQHRLSPQQAAEAKLRIRELTYPPTIFKNSVLDELARYRGFSQNKEWQPGFTCRAGNSVFWVNYDGMMSACSFTREPLLYDVFSMPFAQAWESLLKNIQTIHLAKECHDCRMSVLCGRCASAAFGETGTYEGVPRYHCELTRHYIELLEAKEKEYQA
ncbi:MAG: radical SAM protein [Clostridia bacterium]|nr:radical SAM protein [Clostridia bacterium]